MYSDSPDNTDPEFDPWPVVKDSLSAANVLIAALIASLGGLLSALLLGWLLGPTVALFLGWILGFIFMLWAVISSDIATERTRIETEARETAAKEAAAKRQAEIKKEAKRRRVAEQKEVARRRAEERKILAAERKAALKFSATATELNRLRRERHAATAKTLQLWCRGSGDFDSAHLPPRPVPKPAPRLVRDAWEAEALVVDWLQHLGWPTAAATRKTGDAGIDAFANAGRGGGVGAQVKFEAMPIGRPRVQQLAGACLSQGLATSVFVSSAGYTPQAIAEASSVGMALLRFTTDGRLSPENSAARALLNPPSDGQSVWSTTHPSYIAIATWRTGEFWKTAVAPSARLPNGFSARIPLGALRRDELETLYTRAQCNSGFKVQRWRYVLRQAARGDR